jgi:uncharacterized protein with beta-barrel porin domain
VVVLALATTVMWPGSRAEAACATTQAAVGDPVSYTCAANTATTPGPVVNAVPNNPATSERNQIFATSINGQINSGVTVSVNGVSLQSDSMTPGAVVTMINNGVISNSTNAQAALSIGANTNNSFGTFTYSGTGNITNTGTTAGSSGLSISNILGTGGTNVMVGGTISSVADIGIIQTAVAGANLLTVQTGGMVSGATDGVAVSGTANTLTNSGTIQGTGTGPSGSSGAISSQDLTVMNSGSIKGFSTGVTANNLSLTNNAGSISATGTGGSGIIAGSGVVIGSLSGSNAGTISGDQAGIQSNGAVSLTSNSGMIMGTGAAGLGISAAGITLSANTGTISGGNTAINSLGLNNNINVTNSSVISGGNTGITGLGALTLTNNTGAMVSGGSGAVAGFNGLVTIGNSGTITSAATASSTIAGSSSASNIFKITNNASGLIQNTGSGAIAIAVGNLTLNNFGTVLASGGGSSQAISGAGGAITVTNSGMISAGSAAIDSAGATTVTNNVGGIILASGGASSIAIRTFNAATVTNSGTVSAGFAAIGSTGAITITNNVGGIIQTNQATSAAILNSGVGATTTVVTNNGAIFSPLDGINTATSASTTVVNSGTVTGTTDAGVRVNTASVTNNASGMISGATGVTFRAGNGASTVFNAGTIAGTGGTAIQFSTGSTGNALTIAPKSAVNGTVLGAGRDVLQLGGASGTDTFNLGNIGTTQQYRGFTTFNKVDGSTWFLAGTGSQSWTASGGVLGGTATIGGLNVLSGGTLMPGNGTAGSSLSVNGSLAFQSGAQYLVQISPTTSSFTGVTGTATLGNATVDASFTGSGFVAKRYTIVTAGNINGTFNNSVVTTNLPSDFQGILTYDANHAFLNLTLGFAGLNGNQQQVGNALINSFNANGTIPLTFGSLTPAGLSQASGEAATGSQQTTFDAMTQFMGLLMDLSIAGRGDVATPPATPPHFADGDDDASAYAASDSSRAAGDAFASIYRKAPATADTLSHRWNVWAAGFGGSQTTDGNATLGSSATTSHISGGAVGADYRISPSTLAGFALAGGGTGFSLANGLGGGRSDLFQAGAYLRHTAGPAYISAALAYGWQDITTDRTLTISGVDRLQAQFNANAFSGRVEGGYRFSTPWMVGISPYAAAQFTTFDLPAYAEQALLGANTFALSYAAKDVTASRSELGVRSDKSWAMQDAILTLRGRLAWAHDFDTDRNVGATFQTLPGASFVVNGAQQAHDAALTTASAEMKWLNGVSLAATFEGEFSNVTRSYAGKGVARYSW